MSRRKRPILYEVFGGEKQMKGSARGASKRERTRAHKAAKSRWSWGASLTKEIRVSYELAAVIGLLTVVLGGTLYYFGWVRGSDGDPEMSLAHESPTLSGGSARPSRGTPGPKPTPGKSSTESFHAVRVWTASWKSGASATEIQSKGKLAQAVAAFLENRGFPNARALKYPRARRFRVYIGKARKSSALSSLVQRVRRVSFEGARQFKSAYVEKITVKK